MKIEGEIWRDVPGYGGHYMASNIGRIMVKDRIVTKRHYTGKIVNQFYKGRLLNPCKSDKLGHQSVHIGFDGKKINVTVHKLVLLAFVGYPKEGQEACHNNGIANDNRVENLRWDTHLSNNRDRILHGTYLVGSKHKMSKLTDDDVIKIRESGMNFNDVPEKFGISRSQAWRICRMKSWKHI